MLSTVEFFVGLLCLSQLVFANLGNLPSGDDVELVFVGFRHAERWPGDFFKDDPNNFNWHPQGPNQLSARGHQQAYGLGLQARQRYLKLVGDQWFLDNTTKAMTSPAERCQMTTAMMLAGYYKPVDWAVWDPSIAWQPIPTGQSVPLLRMYDLNDCNPQVQAWDVVDAGNTTEGQAIIKQYGDIMSFATGQEGWDNTLSKMGDVADNLKSMKSYNLSMPAWVTNNPFNKDISDEIIEIFGEGPQKLCAAYTPCRWLMAGYWLSNIYDNLQMLFNGTQKQKMFVYGSHNEIVTSLFWTMGVQLNGVEYNGAIILEAKTKPSKQIRIIYSYPNDNTQPEQRNSTVQYTPGCAQSAEGWCDYDTWYNNVKPYIIPDYKVPCLYPACFCAPTGAKVTNPSIPNDPNASILPPGWM